MWYLVYKYYDLRAMVLASEDSQQPFAYDYIGPFPAQFDAQNHQANYGPTAAEVVRKPETPEPLMSPEEHVEYLKARM